MSKMNELSQMIDKLIACGETLVETGQTLKAFYSSDEEADTAKPAPKTRAKKEAAPKEEAPAPETKKYSKEDVRGILAAKANEAGGRYKASVKAIVKKYSDGGSLTDVPADSYEALVKEMEGLIDG